MQSDRWRRIEEVFHLAADLAGEDREALLARECGSDTVLRDEVERLLLDDVAPDALLDSLEHRVPARDPLVGQQLGAYRLVSCLAEGGMGVVYEAERVDGLFDHRVAVKCIRAERATPGMVRRFELERRTLAGLEHPSIARLLDGGTTDDGRPYLVMELVRGVPIDRYCDQVRASVSDRVRLFLEVCRAVHHAHKSLVVHRDLKPSNILVDASGAPKLLDFGIARLLQEHAQEGDSATLPMERMLTPGYAAPEQLTGGAVTTAIDVYSLGVILYELLTGARPFRADSSPSEWARTLTERTPRRPSTALALDAAAQRGQSPRALERRLRGDLDRIVLMALRKEPERRYASAEAMADDLERHLTGRAVVARGDSLAYRAATFVRRNRLAVASAALVFLALAVGLLLARNSERRARALAESARIESASFAGIAEFLKETFLTATVAQDSAGLEIARESVLDYAERVRRQYADADPIRGNLLDALGQVCAQLGLVDDAQILLEESAALRAATYGPRTIEVARSLRNLGQLAYRRGDFVAAVDSLREALDLHRTCEPGAHTDVAALANDLAACLRRLGRGEEALTLHLEALALRRQDGDVSLPVAESLNNMAAVYMDGGEYNLAVERLGEARRIRHEILGASHSLTLQTESNLASALWLAGRHADARELLRSTEDGYRALRGDGEEGLCGVLSNRGWMDFLDGDYEPAETALLEALELASSRLGEEHPLAVEILGKLAQVGDARGDEALALARMEQVVALRRRAPDAVRDLGNALCSYGRMLAVRGRSEDARPVLEEALDTLRTVDPVDLLTVGRTELVLGGVLSSLGQTDSAAAHWAEADRLLAAHPRATEEERREARAALESSARE